MSFRYLALDLGAESGRSILAELADHKLSLTELHRFANIPVRLPNGLYWDTFRLFYDICEGIRASGKATDHLDGIAVDTWGVDFGLIGADGSIVECPRHYRDARTQGTPEQVFAKVPRSEIFQQTGIQSMEINSLYQLFALQRDAPSALQRASKLLFMPDLFNYFLTGAYACERTIASTSQFYDPVKRTFATDMLRKLGIHASFFAELVDPGAQLGPLLPQVAEQCGLRRDAIVYATGSHDTASAVAAAPVVDDGHWCYISSGTWSLMGVETDQPVINEESLRANFTNEVGVRGRFACSRILPACGYSKSAAALGRGQVKIYICGIDGASRGNQADSDRDRSGRFSAAGQSSGTNSGILPQVRPGGSGRCWFHGICHSTELGGALQRGPGHLRAIDRAQHPNNTYRGRRIAQSFTESVGGESDGAESGCGSCGSNGSGQCVDTSHGQRRRIVVTRIACNCQAIV